MTTAPIIIITPKAICSVKYSLKKAIPTTRAVIGSIAPSTEVMVDPIRFIDSIRAKLDRIVGMNAKRSKYIPDFISGMGCIFEKRVMPVKIINPPIKKI